MLKEVIRYAVAGAAGITLLDAVGYADIVVRGRPASSAPAQVVEELATK
jgi:hypothetical protein